MKFCKRCNADTERYKDGKCSPCVRARNRRYAAEDPEGTRARDRRLRVMYPIRELLLGARRRARKAGVEFTITAADVVIPERCPWLDIPLTVGCGKVHDGSPSLDRIIPEIGYVRGNVIVISHRANSIKSNATPEQLARVLAGLRSAYPQWLLID